MQIFLKVSALLECGHNEMEGALRYGNPPAQLRHRETLIGLNHEFKNRERSLNRGDGNCVCFDHGIPLENLPISWTTKANLTPSPLTLQIHHVECRTEERTTT